MEEGSRDGKESQTAIERTMGTTGTTTAATSTTTASMMMMITAAMTSSSTMTTTTTKNSAATTTMTTTALTSSSSSSSFATDPQTRGSSRINLSDLTLTDDIECKFSLGNFKMLYVVNSESYLYKHSSLLKAKKVSCSTLDWNVRRSLYGFTSILSFKGMIFSTVLP